MLLRGCGLEMSATVLLFISFVVLAVTALLVRCRLFTRIRL